MKYSVVIVCVCALLFSCKDEKEKTYPKKMPLTESVYASATIQPDSLYQAYSKVLGILDKIWVEEGDTVNRGDPILQITNTSPELNVQNAQLALKLAQENYQGRAAVLTSIQDEINAAKLKLSNDSINYFRQKNLWDQNIGSKVEYDSKQLAYELSRSNLNLLQSKYTQTKNELETQLKQSENNYKSSLTNSGDFTITSKINGTVYAIYKNPGEIVNTQEPVAALGKTDKFIIELLVDEVDIVKLKIGQQVFLTLDSYNSQVFEATLDKIYPRKDERSQTFLVEALFNDPPNILYPGLSGEGNIVVSKKEEALTIPKEYLIGDSKVLTDDGETTITLGLQNLDMVEVVDGLDETTAIYKPEP
ncbi:efflux RND transporter periplasmic adaptor subunit [Flagellimonas zhangzhouensis]|uniref:Multidrug efflux pump subunit AcrA (Membrane-fusion protein) n=1 Tax=Flagellimonas zhangzhouensis TaxID=1073328 RepID=A0A1H2Z6U3_9FLAO|nr:efflux RND transporter periplasmic adaptor subunit [Allomuricauda zhangzhouensis]SDR07285.1 Multidrug efflux pump subunit AcrA (membrane-fusion protein) [Allomuricauda zhangzhouensis]SDX13045.1 Multidrug efflux pump subunit AcrA (membrane-fusion protein) [Allomuricauda zhangzhouensis]